MKREYIYGIHAVAAMLKHEGKRAKELWVMKGRRDHRVQALVNDAETQGLVVYQHPKTKLDDVAEGGVHQGVVLACQALAVRNEKDLAAIVEAADQPLLLVLDGVTDPHNLGACLRTAEAAGVQAVIAPKDKSAPLNATAAKVACGAADIVPYVQVTNLARTLKNLQDQGVWIIGTAGETDLDVYSANLTGPMALVMGAEGKGMRRLTREHCDQLVKIPMAGTVSSLNVSVATGVCLFEIVRQRKG
ncbi:MAG: 23S rRNA (guanosine(2251)-2'-O)-methyltransferase RlmB [Pontibacterium sp.]